MRIIWRLFRFGLNSVTSTRPTDVRGCIRVCYFFYFTPISNSVHCLFELVISMSLDLYLDKLRLINWISFNISTDLFCHEKILLKGLLFVLTNDKNLICLPRLPTRKQNQNLRKISADCLQALEKNQETFLYYFLDNQDSGSRIADRL